jgi:hypothetical protein
VTPSFPHDDDVAIAVSWLEHAPSEAAPACAAVGSWLLKEWLDRQIRNIARARGIPVEELRKSWNRKELENKHAD